MNARQTKMEWYDWIGLLLTGFKRGSTYWSNLRRFANRISIGFVIVLLIEANSESGLDYLGPVAAFTVGWSATFFFLTVASVVYLGGSESDFTPGAFRLIFDIMISAALSIMAFSLMYRLHGLIDTLDAAASPQKQDFLYFSIVSFSTLGYGDFRVEASGRLWAGLHAIYGNLHLGLLAGAVFYALQKGTAPRASGEDDDGNHD